MNLRSVYFYVEYIGVAMGRGVAIYLFGIKGEKLFNKTLIRFFKWKIKCLHKPNDSRQITGLMREASGAFPAKNIGKKNITIIVPVYNAYEELKACLVSLINKTPPPTGCC